MPAYTHTEGAFNSLYPLSLTGCVDVKILTRVRLLARVVDQSSGVVGATPGSSGSLQIQVSLGIVGYLKYSQL